MIGPAGSGLRPSSIATGIGSLDRELGGLRCGALHLISGEEGSGKTSIALQTSCIASRENRQVFWLDCAGKLHMVRLKRIADHWGADTSRIMISTPNSFKEQERLIEWLADKAPEDGLVIVDDFTYLHRIEMSYELVTDEPLFFSLTFQVAMLKEAAITRGITVVITSGVHEQPPERGPKPIASSIITFFPDTHIHLSILRGGVRVLKMLRNREEKEYRFRIFDGGVEED